MEVETCTIRKERIQDTVSWAGGRALGWLIAKAPKERSPKELNASRYCHALMLRGKLRTNNGKGWKALISMVLNLPLIFQTPTSVHFRTPARVLLQIKRLQLSPLTQPNSWTTPPNTLPTMRAPACGEVEAQTQEEGLVRRNEREFVSPGCLGVIIT